MPIATSPATPTPEDDVLINDLLSLMAQDGADFTNTFATFHPDQFIDTGAFNAWKDRWDARRDTEPRNPVIIPRNHQIEAVIAKPPTDQEVVRATFCGT